MIKDYYEFVEELATCCAGLAPHKDPHAMAFTWLYRLSKPVDVERLDKLLDESPFIGPCGRYEATAHWVLEIMDHPVKRPDKPLKVEQLFLGRWYYSPDEG